MRRVKWWCNCKELAGNHEQQKHSVFGFGGAWWGEKNGFKTSLNAYCLVFVNEVGE